MAGWQFGVWRAGLLLCGMSLAAECVAQNQTDTVTPLQGGPGPFSLSLREVDFGATPMPRLQSYAAGTVDGKWVLIAGRTQGVHGLDTVGYDSFSPPSFNRDVWVIDPQTREAWRRSLGDPPAGGVDPSTGLSHRDIAALSSSNTQFEQLGNLLYLAGGYGIDHFGEFTTFDQLTAIDLPGLADWVLTGNGQAASHIRKLEDPRMSVTGGAMYSIAGRTHLVFGQDFEGPYSPRTTGAYTEQIRSFQIVDDGTQLSISNYQATAPNESYRRRDLNVLEVIRPDAAGDEHEGLVALSGVFTPGFGAWTVPVEIDATGQPSMADPLAPSTFKQGFNGYHSAKLGLYSDAAGRMDLVLLGGISQQYLDPADGMVHTDLNFPWVNDLTVVSIEADGSYSQRHLGYFPTIDSGNGAPWRFGANAEFFLAPGIETYENGVIRSDLLTGPTVVGYVFGGIATNGPHVSGSIDVISVASHRVFEVVYNPTSIVVPEPSSAVTILLAGLIALRRRSSWLATARESGALIHVR